VEEPKGEFISQGDLEEQQALWKKKVLVLWAALKIILLNLVSSI